MVCVRVHFVTFTKLVGVTWTPDGLGRHGGGDAPVIAVLPLVVVVDGDLVLARDLPGDAARVAHDVAVVDARLRRSPACR